MLHRLPLLFLCFALCTNAYGQGGGTIKGEVSDSATLKMLDAAVVVLLKMDSNTIVKSAFTEDGKFQFNDIPEGEYLLKVDLLGYYPKTIKANSVFTVVEDHKVSLAPKAVQLGEAEILSEKPVIRTTAGKIIFDVAKTVSDGAETATESLQKIPGVTVGQDGAVTVRGKSNVKILVDGKSNPMAETNPEQFLKSIPAKNIETIEVNTAPSAKYDAEGSGIVINIKLRKGKLEGLNGSVTAGVGTLFNKYNGSGNINYKKGKINLFGNGYYNRQQTWNKSSDERKIMSADSVSYINQYTNGTNLSQNGSGKAGFEYSFDKRHSITYSADGSYWQWKQNYTGNGDVRNAANETVNTNQSWGNRFNEGLNITNSVNYQQTFDTTGKMLTIDIAHTLDKNNSVGASNSRMFDTAGMEIPLSFFRRRNTGDGNTHNILLQSDFTTPLKYEGSEIETGLKEELSLYDNTANVFNGASGTDIKDMLQSSRFKYIESISAAYVTYTGEYKAFSYSGGLRWEHTYVTSATASVNQNYASLFPSLTLGLEVADEHTITLSYGRTIQRPGFWMMNNAVRYLSPFAVWMGNPTIKPAFTNSVNLEYNGSVKNQSFDLTGSFEHTGGTFQSITTIDSNQVSYSRYENAGTQMNANVSADGTFKITKWWDLSFNVGYTHSWFEYMYNGSMQRSSGSVFNFWGSTTFRFWKNASLQIWGWGNTGYLGAQSKMKPVGNVTITLKKKFFKDHFIVAISCRDAFNTMQWSSHLFNPNLDAHTYSKNESLIGFLTLTYQFGKQTFSPDSKTKKGNRSGGGGDGGG